jgi:hypothetical protein
LAACALQQRLNTDTSDHAGPGTSLKCAMYIFRNRARMRYPKFRAQGLCTSTGVVEAGCKVAIGTQLKRLHAQVRRWRKRHHRPALLQTQWTL